MLVHPALGLPKSSRGATQARATTRLWQSSSGPRPRRTPALDQGQLKLLQIAVQRGSADAKSEDCDSIDDDGRTLDVKALIPGLPFRIELRDEGLHQVVHPGTEHRPHRPLPTVEGPWLS